MLDAWFPPRRPGRGIPRRGRPGALPGGKEDGRGSKCWKVLLQWPESMEVVARIGVSFLPSQPRLTLRAAVPGDEVKITREPPATHSQGVKLRAEREERCSAVDYIVRHSEAEFRQGICQDCLVAHHLNISRPRGMK